MRVGLCLLFALLRAATPATAIDFCQQTKYEYYGHERDWCGSANCNRGGTHVNVDSVSFCWPDCCQQGACRVTVCSNCINGYYKEIDMRYRDEQWGTECKPCADVRDCSGVVTCTSGVDQQCTQCRKGYHLIQASGNTKADTCDSCSYIPNCQSGRLSCTTANDQVCEACNTGYYLANDDTECRPCQHGCSSCASYSLERSLAGCWQCSEDYFENHNRSQCIAGCPDGQYLVGDEYCTQCPGMTGCTAETRCSDALDVWCPTGGCNDQYYFTRTDDSSHDTCHPREPKPNVTVRGYEALISWSGASDSDFYSRFIWTAEIEQETASSRKKIDLPASESRLKVSWNAATLNGQLTADRSFRTRLERTPVSGGSESATLWSDYFSFSCECNSNASGRSGMDGQPTVMLVQDKSLVYFYLQYNSYCASVYVAERDIGIGLGFEYNREWRAVGMDCSASADSTRYDDLATRNLIQETLGKEIWYRFHARNAAINYDAAQTHAHRVEFWAVVRGAVHSEDHRGVQMEGVKISVLVDSPLGGETLVWSDVTRAKGGGAFEYEIVVQSAQLATSVVPVLVTAQYPSEPSSWQECAEFGGECDCAEGFVRLTNGTSHREKNVNAPLVCDYTSFPGVVLGGQVECLCTRAMHYFDCPDWGEACKVTDDTVPAALQTHHVELNLAHTEEHIVTFFDKSTYTLAGKVTMYDAGDCGLMDVEVCPYAAGTWDRLRQGCVYTDVHGSYSIAVVAGRSVTLRPAFRNSTARDFLIERDTIQHVFSNSDGFNFQYLPQQTVSIEVGGGECLYPIGSFELKVTMNACSGYERRHHVSSFTELYLGPADFTIRVEMFTEREPPLSERIGAGTVLEYLHLSNQQTKYVKFWSLQDADELEAKLDSSGNAQLEFIYRSPLQFEFVADPGQPKEMMCGTAELSNEILVAEQHSAGTLKVLIYENYGADKCERVSGEVKIVDQVTDIPYQCSRAEGCTTAIDQVEHRGRNVSGIQLPLVPGDPELTPPHERKFFFYWDDPGRVGEEALQPLVFPVLVTGQRTLGDSFSVTLTEGVPRVILYDPPGGQSFSQLVQGATLSTTLKVSSSKVKGLGKWWHAGGGLDWNGEVCAGLGVKFCKGVWELVIEGYRGKDKSTADGTQNVAEYTHTNVVESVVSTSSAADLPGFYSDVVVSSALTVTFEKTRRLDIIPEECKSEGRGVRLSYDALYRPALEGFVVKSFFDIEFVELPKIAENMRILEDKLDQNQYSIDDDGNEEKALDRLTLQKLNTTQHNWRSLIAAHENRAGSGVLASADEALKSVSCHAVELEEATEVLPEPVEVPCENAPDSNLFNFGTENSRLFFAGGGTSVRYSTGATFEQTQTHTQTFDMSDIGYIHFRERVGVAGVFFESEQGEQWVTEVSSAKETSSQTAETRTVLFELSDPDVGDSFDVEILYDQEYGTPYFKTIAGASMCPGEDGTVHRMQAELHLDGLHDISGIPAGETVVLPVQVINRSPTGEDEGEYVLLYDQASNANGLQMSVDGQALAERVIRRIPMGERLHINLEAERGAGQYDFEDISLQLVPRCELDLDVQRRRETSGAELVFSLHWRQDCPRVKFNGPLAAYETFTVSYVPGASVYSLSVMAKDPDHFSSPWHEHPKLEDVSVQYRRAGDSLWNLASKTDGSFARLDIVSDSTGFESVEVDVTFWDDGEYELSLEARCGNEPVPVGSFRSAVISGLIDRQAPRLFSAFAEPADGRWVPGDRIAARLTEVINCQHPYSFDVHLVVRRQDGAAEDAANENLRLDKDHLDVSCSGDTVELAFSAYSILYQVPDLRNMRATVYFDNVQDLAGNSQQGIISWSFDIGSFDAENTAVILSLQFKDIDIELYEVDPEGFESTVANEVCSLLECEAASTRRQLSRPVVHAHVEAGTIWADVALPAKNSLSLAAELYEHMGNETHSTLPSTMLLAGAQVYKMAYIGGDSADPEDEDESNRGGPPQAEGDVDGRNSDGHKPDMTSIVLGAVCGMLVLALASTFVARHRRMERVGPVQLPVSPSDAGSVSSTSGLLEQRLSTPTSQVIVHLEQDAPTSRQGAGTTAGVTMI